MKRYVRHETFDIYCFEASEWQHPVHNHTYFEVIFIRGGTGTHILNGNTLSYQKGDVFLLGPEDYHYFIINTTTQFAFIRFTENFVKDTSSLKHKDWQGVIESLFTSQYQSNSSVVTDDQEKAIVGYLMTVLLHEYENRHIGSYEMIIDCLMKALLSILVRNLIQQTRANSNEVTRQPLLDLLIIHIRQHICSPEQLKMEYMAAKFHFSPNYLSTFFKNKVGESLQQYIIKYKLGLVANSLLNSNKTLFEISFEFGFTDESHLSKVFRKHYGQSPGLFRKNNAKVSVS